MGSEVGLISREPCSAGVARYAMRDGGGEPPERFRGAARRSVHGASDCSKPHRAVDGEQIRIRSAAPRPKIGGGLFLRFFHLCVVVLR